MVIVLFFNPFILTQTVLLKGYSQLMLPRNSLCPQRGPRLANPWTSQAGLVRAQYVPGNGHSLRDTCGPESGRRAGGTSPGLREHLSWASEPTPSFAQEEPWFSRNPQLLYLGCWLRTGPGSVCLGSWEFMQSKGTVAPL